MAMTDVDTSALAIMDALKVLDHARACAFELEVGDEIAIFRADPEIDRCENDSGYRLHTVSVSEHDDKVCHAGIPKPGQTYHRDHGHRGMCWTIKTHEGEHYNCSPWNTGAFKVGRTR